MVRRNLSDKKILAQIPKARLSAAQARVDGLRAVSAKYDPDAGRIVVETTTGHLFGFPVAGIAALQSASPDELQLVELSPSGSGLHWEQLDVDLDLPALLLATLRREDRMRELARSAGSVTSERKAAAARVNGAKGGRPSAASVKSALGKTVLKVYADTPRPTTVEQMAQHRDTRAHQSAATRLSRLGTDHTKQAKSQLHTHSRKK